MKRPVVALACVLTACVGIGAQVPNETCASYTWVYDGINPGAPNGASGSFFSNATAGAPSEIGATACYASPDYRDVWFRWISTSTGWATFSTCTPPGFAPGTATTDLVVYSNCLGSLVGCGTPPASCPTGSSLLTPVTAGGSYLIRVASPWTAPLGGSFYLTITPPAPPPANDNQANAIPVSVGTNPASGSYTISGATLDGTGFCATLSDVDVWFTHTPATSGIMTVTTGGLALRISDPGGNVVTCSLTGSSGSINLTAGVTYLIRVWAPNGTQGGFNLVLTAPVAGASNDECTGAIPVGLGANGPFTPGLCSTSPGFLGCFAGDDVWYQFTNGPCTAVYTASICGSFGFAVYSGCSPAAFFQCSYGYSANQVSTCSLESTAYFVAPPNTTWRFRVIAAGQPHTITIVPGVHALGASYMSLGWTSPFGPGSIQGNVAGGPPSGLYFLAATTTPPTVSGPLSWGVNMTHAELVAQFLLGPPFTGSFDSCGALQIGPFSGAPSGLTVHTAVLGFASVYSETPTIYSYPVTYVIP